MSHCSRSKSLVLFAILFALIGVFGQPAAGTAAGEKRNADQALSKPASSLAQQFVSSDAFVLRRGSQPGAVGIREGPDGELPIGPSSITTVDGAHLYILDSVNNRILLVSADGSLQGEMPLGITGWPSDVAVSASGDLYVLDARANRLLTYDSSGKSSAPPLSLDPAFQSNRVAATAGEVQVEGYELGAGTTQPVLAVKAWPLTPAGGMDRGSSARTYPAEQSTRKGALNVALEKLDARSGRVHIQQDSAETDLLVETQAPLAFITLIDSDRAGNFYVLVSSFASSDPTSLLFASRLDKYSPAGQLLASAPLPMDLYSFPDHPFTVTPDGTVYQMVPEKDRVRIVRWSTVDAGLSTVGAPPSWTPTSESPTGAEATPLVATLNPMTRDQIMSIALTYSNHTWTVGPNNYAARTCSNSCPVGPAAWSVGTSITGVAYQWGGYDTVAQFDSKLAQGYLAGDVSGTVCTGNCATGVDCAGYVQQTWQILDQKHNVDQLMSATYSQPINWSDLARGDALGLPGSHITLFANWDAQGHPAIYEATWGDIYKVRYFVDTVGRLNGYQARRRYDVSDPVSTCPAPSSTGPADGYVSSSRTVSFAWSGPSGCTYQGYTFRVKDTSNMESGGTTIYDEAQAGTSVTKTFASQWDGRDLYWGVRTANPSSPNWSVRRFRIQPPCVSPTPGSNEVVLFSQPNYGGACVKFGIGEYPDPNQLNPVGNDSTRSIRVGSGVKALLYIDWNFLGGVTELTADDPDLIDKPVQYATSSVKVQARVLPPEAPSNLRISNKTDTTLTLAWNDNSTSEDGFRLYKWGYDGTKWTYRYLTSVGPDVTSYIDTGLACGTDSFYEVSAYNSGGQSDLSPWAQGTTSDCAGGPAGFAKSGPANGARGLSTRPALTWQPSAGATSYEVCADTTNDNVCQSAYGWYDVGNITSFSVPITLATGKTYYWQVRAKNAAGTLEADRGSWWSMTIGTSGLPGAFAKLSPANAALGQTLRPTITWSASAGAKSYELCLDTTNDGVCQSPYGWHSVGSVTSFTLPISLLSAETYHWQVRARNTYGLTYADNGMWRCFETQ